jgi:hypothetical protein
MIVATSDCWQILRCRFGEVQVYMNQIDGSEPLREILTFRRNVEKLRIGTKRDGHAPHHWHCPAHVARTALSSFNDGVRRYEDSHRPGSTRYNAYLGLSHG